MFFNKKANFENEIASDMVRIMDSAEHKMIFQKNAQATQEWTQPAAPAPDKAVLTPAFKAALVALYNAFATKTSIDGTDKPKRTGQDEVLLKLISKAKSNLLTSAELVTLQTMLKSILTGEKVAALGLDTGTTAQLVPPDTTPATASKQHGLVAKAENDKCDDKDCKDEDCCKEPAEKKDSKVSDAAIVIDLMTKIADYLGENKFSASEAVADRLLKTYALELSHKPTK